MIRLTQFIERKMRNTFSKYFTNQEAKWDSNRMIFDSNHSCDIFIISKRNVFLITLCEGNAEEIIRFVQSWFREYNIPYMISCEKKHYTPFPETEYLIAYYKEMRAMQYQDMYQTNIHFLFNLEHQCIDLYYEKIEHGNKMISVSKRNFDEWKKEALEETGKLQSFQNKVNKHIQAFPISDDNESYEVKKAWIQKDWEYVIQLYGKSYYEKELTEEFLEKIISFYNSNYAAETIFKNILTETKKIDPYVFVKRGLNGGRFHTVYTFGERFLYDTSIWSDRDEIEIKFENTKISIPKTSCLVEKEITHYVQTIFKTIKGARLSSVMREKSKEENEEEQAILSMLRVYFNLGANKIEKIVSQVKSKQDVYKELWNYFKDYKRQDIIHITESNKDFLETESYIIEISVFSEVVFKQKG